MKRIGGRQTRYIYKLGRCVRLRELGRPRKNGKHIHHSSIPDDQVPQE